MKFYNYSREKAINRVTKLYDEFLLTNSVEENVCAESFQETGATRVLFLEGVPAELNKKMIAAILAAGQRRKTVDISNAITTVELLGDILFALVNNMMDSVEDRLKTLLRRFEATGKIHEGYTEDFKGVGSYAVINNYVLLAVTLLIYYKSDNSPKTLNAVLKLNDLIELLIDEINTPELFPLIIYSFVAEEREVKRLYDDRGFRLSAGQ